MEHAHRAHHTRRPHPAGSGLVFGILIVGAGLLLLLDQLGALAPHQAWDFWPLLLVVFGALALLRPSQAPHRFLGGLLILTGLAVQVELLDLIAFDLSLLWPALLILFGLYVFWVAWRQRGGDGDIDLESDDAVDALAVFGGTQTVNTSQRFAGGVASAVFGGCELDLTRAEIQGEQAVLHTRALFGGVDIRVPEHWNVVVKGIGILGGYEDKSRHPKPEPDAETPVKNLILKGYAMFGGVDVKN